jgi:viologen exporter family transport system permease protein
MGVAPRHQALCGGGQLTGPAGPIRLAALHLKLGALNELQYRANFWVQLLNSVIGLGTGILAIAIVYSQTDTLGGWSADELLAVMGVHLMVGGFLRALVQPNMWQLLEDVREGTLDYTLTRPADSQLLVSVRQFSLWSLVDVVLGLGVVVWSVTRISSNVGWLNGAGFVLALICGTIIVYSIWISAATLAFKVVQIDNLMQLMSGIYEAGRWPVGIYPGWLRGALTFLIPLAFAVTVPAEALSARIEWSWLALAVGVAIVTMVGSRAVWRWGIRNYSGASA